MTVLKRLIEAHEKLDSATSKTNTDLITMLHTFKDQEDTRIVRSTANDFEGRRRLAMTTWFRMAGDLSGEGGVWCPENFSYVFPLCFCNPVLTFDACAATMTFAGGSIALRHPFACDLVSRSICTLTTTRRPACAATKGAHTVERVHFEYL